MSQHDQVIANASGAVVRADINAALAAIFGNSSGASAPSTTVAYQLWADTTTNLLKRRNAANSGWLVVCSLSETFQVARSSNTILAGSDVGKTFVATSTFTQTLTAAATLGDGWWCKYRNDGTGIITLDPNSSETIDGSTTLKLYPAESCIIDCNGSAFKTIGRTRKSCIVNFSMAAQTVAAGATQYIGASLVSATEGNVTMTAPFACRVRNLYMNSSAVPGGGQTFTYTFRVAGADTAVTSTTSGGASSGSSDTTNEVALAKGDVFDMKLVTSGGAAVCTHWGSLELEATE